MFILNYYFIIISFFLGLYSLIYLVINYDILPIQTIIKRLLSTLIFLLILIIILLFVLIN